MPRPDTITVEVKDETSGEVEYTYKYEPIAQWTYDHYVGVRRAEELGLWKSNTDPNRTWAVEGTITIYDSDMDYARLVVESDNVKWTLEAYIDQWGTYYSTEGTLYVASEEGRRGFWNALIEAQREFTAITEFKMKDAKHETFEKVKEE